MTKKKLSKGTQGESSLMELTKLADTFSWCTLAPFPSFI